jgi:hypothetical protein
LATQKQADIDAGLVEWGTFVIAGDKNGGDGREGAISIKDTQNVPTRRWILFEQSAEFYSINLYDGKAILFNGSSFSMLIQAGVSVLSQSYANITLIAKRSRTPSV